MGDGLPFVGNAIAVDDWILHDFVGDGAEVGGRCGEGRHLCGSVTVLV